MWQWWQESEAPLRPGERAMKVAHSVYTELQGRGGHRALRCQSSLCQAVLSSAQGLDETSQPEAPSC